VFETGSFAPTISTFSPFHYKGGLTTDQRRFTSRLDIHVQMILVNLKAHDSSGHDEIIGTLQSQISISPPSTPLFIQSAEIYSHPLSTPALLGNSSNPSLISLCSLQWHKMTIVIIMNTNAANSCKDCTRLSP